MTVYSYCNICKKFMKAEKTICPKCAVKTVERETHVEVFLAYEPERNTFSMLRG